ncbi:phiSA1p31-related protein [Streptomyces sp. NPDC096324]|uniref:phiSA1p31-related protein n=1 Tax=Streptomyces sp. NPDC096324 TaxID=3366085 RepID=UPI00382F5769
MTILLDGTEIDLDRVQIALDGTRWLWTCEHTESGDPLMLRTGKASAGILPLPDVYAAHGPLVPVPQPTTAALYRQALEAAP